MDLLARREHSRLELQQKLLKRFSGQADEIASQIEQLNHEGLQSDSRLAEAFIRARTSKGQGPGRIRMELRQKGVDDEIISLAMEESEVDWFQLAEEVANKKFSREFGPFDESPKLEARDRARVARFLQQRGFSYDHISAIC